MLSCGTTLWFWRLLIIPFFFISFLLVFFLFTSSPKRPCNVSDVLVDLVGAVAPLAHEQRRAVLLSEVPRSLQVPIEEPALRQALGNLIEGALLRIQAGGKVEIVATGAPAGGALVIIDDDGLDMHYMVKCHELYSIS